MSNTPKPVVSFALGTTIPVAFFLTCRQLNVEAFSVLYSYNVFLPNRRIDFASFLNLYFISAILKFLDVVGSRGTFVRNDVFDTIHLCKSMFLRTYIDKTMRYLDPNTDIVEVAVLLRHAWDRALNFKTFPH